MSPIEDYIARLKIALTWIFNASATVKNNKAAALILSYQLAEASSFIEGIASAPSIEEKKDLIKSACGRLNYTYDRAVRSLRKPEKQDATFQWDMISNQLETAKDIALQVQDALQNGVSLTSEPMPDKAVNIGLSINKSPTNLWSQKPAVVKEKVPELPKADINVPSAPNWLQQTKPVNAPPQSWMQQALNVKEKQMVTPVAVPKTPNWLEQASKIREQEALLKEQKKKEEIKAPDWMQAALKERQNKKASRYSIDQLLKLSSYYERLSLKLS